MRWMCAYNDICDRACCYSSECACIRCSFCHKSFTSIPGHHMPRLECMQCTSSRATMCEACFTSPAALHDHTRFCHIDERGVHSVAHRTVGLASRRELTPSDLPTVPISELPAEASRQCAVCFCDFDDNTEEMQAVAPPGCVRRYAFAVPDSELGHKDTRSYCCRECHFAFLSYNKRTSYCDINEFRTLLMPSLSSQHRYSHVYSIRLWFVPPQCPHIDYLFYRSVYRMSKYLPTHSHCTIVCERYHAIYCFCCCHALSDMGGIIKRF